MVNIFFQKLFLLHVLVAYKCHSFILFYSRAVLFLFDQSYLHSLCMDFVKFSNLFACGRNQYLGPESDSTI